jgi:hypothetical protein
VNNPADPEPAYRPALKVKPQSQVKGLAPLPVEVLVGSARFARQGSLW